MSSWTSTTSRTLPASSLIGTVAQRLVRMNCPRCRKPIEEKQVELNEIGITQAMLKDRASFVPPQPIHDLRDLTRTRKQLSREIVRHEQRLQAVLEEANVKLTSVITDILGASGRRRGHRAGSTFFRTCRAGPRMRSWLTSPRTNAPATWRFSRFIGAGTGDIAFRPSTAASPTG